MGDEFSYTGIKSLEVLREARNYNLFLENELIEFIKPNTKAVDFGAGVGEFAERISSHLIEVSCVELDQELQEHLKKNKFITYTSIEEIEPVSRIYSLNVLEHIEDDMTALKSIHKKLTEHGKLFLYVPAFMGLYTDFDKHIGHYRRYTRSELMSKLNEAGFKIERAEYVDSIGCICWFIMGKLPTSKLSINPLMVKIFDRFLFPLSRISDRLFNKIFGKNLLIIASPIINTVK